MSFVRLSFVSLCLLAAAGCETFGTTAEDPVAVKLTELENRIIAIERQVESESLVNLYQQLETQQAEIRVLRGEIENLVHDIEGLGSRQRRMYEDLDRRIAGGGGVSGSGSAGGLDSNGDRAAYQGAFDLLKDGNYVDAADGFRRFLSTYPESDRAPNAQYWLGEALYVSREFEKALPEFQEVIASYPQAEKVGDALLKVGFSQYELGNDDDARVTLNRVVQSYPDTTPARLAQQRLDQMNREGR